MKDFLKYVFATVVGLGLAMLLMFVIFFVSIIGMAAGEGATATVKKGSVLRINLNGVLEERADNQDPLSLAMAGLMGDDATTLGLDQLLDAVAEAAKNDKVEGIYMEVGSGFGGGTPAMLQELRQALLKYKESGKWIFAYGDVYSEGAYYLTSLADKIVVNPKGIVDWHGMASVPMFLTDVLAKAGVKMQVFKVGTFKSAVEPYINTEMSEPNRQQVTAYLTSIWNQYKDEIGKSRNLTAEQLDVLADTLTAIQPTELLVESGLVDTLAYIDGFKDMLRNKLGLKEKKPINFVSPADLVAAADKDSEKNRIAVYYAFGDIVDQASSNPITGGGASIETMPTIRELQKLRKDEDVKAVVIRVNSGGGSAFASEQIWHEVELLKAEKPVVVSMGGLAASGGYYISCGANKILAEPSTLTGSIGIFGMFPDATELVTEKLGLHFDVVKTNKYADFGAPTVMGALGRHFTADESALMQASIERGYDLFISRVAEGRGISKDSVDAIGQGRVWTGEQAIKLGLVDQLGNLNDAIAEAAKLAKLDKYSTDSYPAPADFMQNFLNEKKESYFDAHLKASLGEFYPMLGTMQWMMQNRRIDQCIYARVPFEIVIW
ncbi:MAG: signal peptide peptidase SppA [Bacteroidaceae bacterium]|nr:signal peptide peptidase SppA [Bacteroidaceae bacterium]MBR1664753.1 signal peptide peptidase SppA [Bacteroidaceae bacterium]